VVVTLSEPQSTSVTVDYRTANGTAKVGSDYSYVSGRLTFAPGQTEKTIAVPVRGDRVAETDEYFAVRLSRPRGAELDSDDGFVMIWDNEPRLYFEEVSQLEGNTGVSPMAFTVTLSEPYDQSVSVSYRTINGTAQAGRDYNSVSGRLTFARGETSQTIQVPIRGDRAVEADEYFTVRLSNANRAGIVERDGYAIISDDEPRVSIQNASALEGNSGTSELEFTVNLSAAYDLPVTVNYSTADNSALAGSDYLAAAGQIVFAPGQTSQTIAVAAQGDVVPELDKAFFVNVSTTHSYAAVSSGQGIGTILDDEPRLSIGDVLLFSEPSFVFTVSLTTPQEHAISVDFATEDVTAIAGVDYAAVSGTLTFAPGDTFLTITVPVLNPISAGQYFSIRLSNASAPLLVTRDVATGTWYYDYGGYYDYGWGGYDYGYGVYYDYGSYYYW
jgi:hypothetical protein